MYHWYQVYKNSQQTLQKLTHKYKSLLDHAIYHSTQTKEINIHQQICTHSICFSPKHVIKSTPQNNIIWSFLYALINFASQHLNDEETKSLNSYGICCAQYHIYFILFIKRYNHLFENKSKTCRWKYNIQWFSSQINKICTKFKCLGIIEKKKRMHGRQFYKINVQNLSIFMTQELKCKHHNKHHIITLDNNCNPLILPYFPVNEWKHCGELK